MKHFHTLAVADYGQTIHRLTIHSNTAAKVVQKEKTTNKIWFPMVTKKPPLWLPMRHFYCVYR